MEQNNSKSERDKLATAKLNNILKENQAKGLLISKFSSLINNISKIALASSKVEQESVMKSQQTYKRQLIEAIDSITPDKALELLNGAKTTYERYIMDAKIQRPEFQCCRIHS
jgi:hypothetical protein